MLYGTKATVERITGISAGALAQAGGPREEQMALPLSSCRGSVLVVEDEVVLRMDWGIIYVLQVFHYLEASR